MKKYNFIDLFAGIGGFSYGFEKAGFNLKLAIDNNPKCLETFKYNHKNNSLTIFEISENNIENLKDLKVDIIIGSPPCQGFSDSRGNRDPKNKEESLRNSLPLLFVKIIEFYQPLIAILENVSGLATYKLNGKLLIKSIMEEFNRIKYNVEYKILNTLNFGIPQNRKRIFIIAIKNELNCKPVIPDRFNNKNRNISLKDVFQDLPVNISPQQKNQKYTLDYKECSFYQKLLRKKNDNRIFNHEILNLPKKNETKLIKKIPQGKVYRSSRFGNNYIGVWDLFKDELKQDERDLIYFLCKKRTLKTYKELKGKYQEGYLSIDKFPTDKEGKFFWTEGHHKKEKNFYRTPIEIINSLVKNGWLRQKDFKKDGKSYVAYDINTKSGIRPKYKRLNYHGLAPTIQTVSFTVRELIHPIAHRPISLREGARIQGFPDNFIFHGSKRDIAIMIGNAVPPLLSFFIAKHIEKLLSMIEGGVPNLFDLNKTIIQHQDLLECFS
ncbi:MAG: DNA cytosine methyltransferase [Promethearchaeota archaeon]